MTFRAQAEVRSMSLDRSIQTSVEGVPEEGGNRILKVMLGLLDL